MDAQALSSAGPLILLMEDEPLARWLALKTLEETGAQVVEAASCEEARRQLEAHTFDLLVLDYRLPDGTGLSVAESARAGGCICPILLLSADADDFTAAAEGPDALFAAVLAKPLDVEALQTAVREHLPSSEEGAAEQADEPAWVDRFHVLSMPQQLTAEALSTIAPTPADKGWLALNLSGTTEMEPSCATPLDELAEVCLAEGGRLALIAAPDEPVVRMLREHNPSPSYDVLPNTRALEALSRRLSSFCERSSLLASVISAEEGLGL